MMKFFQRLRRKRNLALPMHPENILIIASSPQEINTLIDKITKVGYSINSEIIRLDNGDFSIVIKSRKVNR